MMSNQAYLYGAKISQLMVNDRCEVTFSVKGKDYIIYPSKDGKWIEGEDGLKCKVILFVTDDAVMALVTEGECKGLVDQGWTLLNTWEVEVKNG